MDRWNARPDCWSSRRRSNRRQKRGSGLPRVSDDGSCEESLDELELSAELWLRRRRASLAELVALLELAASLRGVLGKGRSVVEL